MVTLVNNLTPLNQAFALGHWQTGVSTRLCDTLGHNVG